MNLPEKKVTAGALVPARIVTAYLHTTPERLIDMWHNTMLGHVQASPWWAGQARSPGLNGQLPGMVLCPWSGVLTMTILRSSWPSPGWTAGGLA